MLRRSQFFHTSTLGAAATDAGAGAAGSLLVRRILKMGDESIVQPPKSKLCGWCAAAQAINAEMPLDRAFVKPEYFAPLAKKKFDVDFGQMLGDAEVAWLALTASKALLGGTGLRGVPAAFPLLQILRDCSGFQGRLAVDRTFSVVCSVGGHFIVIHSFWVGQGRMFYITGLAKRDEVYVGPVQADLQQAVGNTRIKLEGASMSLEAVRPITVIGRPLQ